MASLHCKTRSPRVSSSGTGFCPSLKHPREKAVRLSTCVTALASNTGTPTPSTAQSPSNARQLSSSKDDAARSRIIATASLSMALGASQSKAVGWLGMLQLFFLPERPQREVPSDEPMFAGHEEDEHEHNHSMYHSHIADRLAMEPARGNSNFDW